MHDGNRLCRWMGGYCLGFMSAMVLFSVACGRTDSTDRLEDLTSSVHDLNRVLSTFSCDSASCAIACNTFGITACISLKGGEREKKIKELITTPRAIKRKKYK